MLVVNKPAGLLVEHNSRFPSVEDWGWTHVRTLPGKNYLGIVHRLDRAVSGALALAKRKSALRALQEQFTRREVRKLYWAICSAPPPEPSGTLTHWLKKDQAGKRALLYNTPHPGAVEVQLRYRLLHRATPSYLLEIDLLTGKFHQIRAQLAAVGCPILGDTRYGSPLPYLPEAIALHARRLDFTDPLTKELATVQAPVPRNTIWEAFHELALDNQNKF